MDFEWDEAKRLTNLAKHGIDFADADLLFGGPYLTAFAKTVDGEERQLAIGLLDDIYVTAVYTMRGNTIRMISFRRADNGERRRYQAVFGGGTARTTRPR